MQNLAFKVSHPGTKVNPVDMTTPQRVVLPAASRCFPDRPSAMRISAARPRDHLPHAVPKTWPAAKNWPAEGRFRTSFAANQAPRLARRSRQGRRATGPNGSPEVIKGDREIQAEFDFSHGCRHPDRSGSRLSCVVSPTNERQSRPPQSRFDRFGWRAPPPGIPRHRTLVPLRR